MNSKLFDAPQKENPNQKWHISLTTPTLLLKGTNCLWTVWPKGTCWHPRACVLMTDLWPPRHSWFLNKHVQRLRHELMYRDEMNQQYFVNFHVYCCYKWIILYRLYIEHVHTLKSVLLPMIWNNITDVKILSYDCSHCIFVCVIYRPWTLTEMNNRVHVSAVYDSRQHIEQRVDLLLQAKILLLEHRWHSNTETTKSELEFLPDISV